MAAFINPSANKNGATTTDTNATNGGGGAAVPENSTVGPSEPALELEHSFTPSPAWTRDQQSLLEELFPKYASYTKELQFAIIAKILRVKARDVALRYILMIKKKKGKQKEDNNSSRKKKDKLKEKVAEQANPSFHVSHHANGLSYSEPSVSTNNDDVISYEAFGEELGKRLWQNAQALNQISANLSALKVHDNINLFFHTRNNLLSISNNLNDVPGLINQFPPLPVKLNEELASYILPSHKS